MINTSLPVGVRLHPTDSELILYYLKNRVMGKPFPEKIIADIDIYKYPPWGLPAKSCWKSKDPEWYFFCPKEKKYQKGDRINRDTGNGFWKTSGRDRPVCCKGKKVGMIKTLIFHTGKAPNGVKTKWFMYEYRLHDHVIANADKDAYVICKIIDKSSPLFNEEEWIDGEESVPLACISAPPSDLQNIQESSVMTSTFIPGTTCIGSSSQSKLACFRENNESENLDDGIYTHNNFAKIENAEIIKKQNIQESSSVTTSIFIPGITCIGSSSQSTSSKLVQRTENFITPVNDEDVAMHKIPSISDDLNSMLAPFCENNEIEAICPQFNAMHKITPVNDEDVAMHKIPSISDDLNSILASFCENNEIEAICPQFNAMHKITPVNDEDVAMHKIPSISDDLNSMLASFCENNEIENLDDDIDTHNNFAKVENAENGKMSDLSENGYFFNGSETHYTTYQSRAYEGAPYMELNDLEFPIEDIDFVLTYESKPSPTCTFDDIEHAPAIYQNSTLPEESNEFHNQLNVKRKKLNTHQGFQENDANVNTENRVVNMLQNMIQKENSDGDNIHDSNFY